MSSLQKTIYRDNLGKALEREKMGKVNHCSKIIEPIIEFQSRHFDEKVTQFLPI